MNNDHIWLQRAKNVARSGVAHDRSSLSIILPHRSGNTMHLFVIPQIFSNNFYQNPHRYKSKLQLFAQNMDRLSNIQPLPTFMQHFLHLRTPNEPALCVGMKENSPKNALCSLSTSKLIWSSPPLSMLWHNISLKGIWPLISWVHLSRDKICTKEYASLKSRHIVCTTVLNSHHYRECTYIR